MKVSSPATCAASDLMNQVFAADDAVLVITEQRLDHLRLLGHLIRAGSRRGVAQSLGALTDPVQRLVASVLAAPSAGVFAVASAAAFAALRIRL